jgi:hypothetical protein
VRGAAVAHTARGAFVDAFDATLWVAVAVAVVASGLVAWLLRVKATRSVEVYADEHAPPMPEAA